MNYDNMFSNIDETPLTAEMSAGNSGRAKVLAAEAAGESNEAMERMAEAVRQIRISSDNTVKISKTIDDIAYQTNLLALSAAVKVTQARESGNGFAVVADIAEALAKAVDNSVKVSGLIAEMAASSSEQIHGIEQINTAITQMNAVAGKRE